jgi:Uma2 family endonuclease
VSITERPIRVTLPPLVEGERLDQPTFHARYEAMPPEIRAELIGGVVSMPSPLSLEHGRAHVSPIVWLSYYAEKTPGVEVVVDATTILGWKSEMQPDVLMRIAPECGGQTRTEHGYIHGAPELVVEVAKASRYIDLGPKLDDYERAGVLEYVVRALDPDEVLWFEQAQGALTPKPSDGDGLFRSTTFPGLWLDPQALLAGDTGRLRAVLDQGLARPEHAAFVARLAAARGTA